MEQTEFFLKFFYLRLYGTSAEGLLLLQPAKDVEFRTICLKSCRQEKKSNLQPSDLRMFRLMDIMGKLS